MVTVYKNAFCILHFFGFLLSSAWGMGGKAASDLGAHLVDVRPKEPTARAFFLSPCECLTVYKKVPARRGGLNGAKYCGENEYSIRPHKPNSVGATPASATNAPTPQASMFAERYLF